MPDFIYLGDSVYAGFDDVGCLGVWTDNGMGRENEIMLEPEVLEALDPERKTLWQHHWQVK